MSDAGYPARAAAGADGWDVLAAAARACRACPELAATRIQVVPGVRGESAEVLLVGEAPGAQEDAQGVPFVGRSGQLLDELLAEAGLDRRQIAVANVLKCRPPANRKPRRAEVERCRPWLTRQIAVVAPRVIVTLGGTAAEWFFGPGARIGQLREKQQAYDGIPLLVTYHPSAAIRFGPRGAPRAALAADLISVAALVQETVGRGSYGTSDTDPPPPNI
jgi:uracil-DNA glycosylase family 4